MVVGAAAVKLRTQSKCLFEVPDLIPGVDIAQMANEAVSIGADMAVSAVPGGKIAKSVVTNVIDHHGLQALDKVVEKELTTELSHITSNPLDFGVDMALEAVPVPGSAIA